MPGKGLEKKRGGVQSLPYKLRRDKLRLGKRTDPAKVFPIYLITILGNRAKNAYGS